MRSTKIENVKQSVQFAFGGFDGHKTDNVHAVVTRKGGAFLLTTEPGTKSEMQREMRRDDRILVDYDTSTVTVKVCAKDPEHGPKVANPSARLTCMTCHVAYHEAKKAAVKAGTWGSLEDADAALTKRDAARRIAEAKVDRLMAMLAATDRTIPQVYRDQDAISA